MGTKQKSALTSLGLDGLDIVVTTNKRIKQKTELKQENKVVGYIKPVKEGYRLHLCLPKLVRDNNVQPFGEMDIDNISGVLEYITNLIKNTFGLALEDATVKSVEINCTATLKDPETVKAIMNLLGLMFLEHGSKVFVCFHGVNDALYRNVPLTTDILRKTPQIESIRTPRLPNQLLCLKFYDKSLEQNITDKGILRLEQVHNAKSLQSAGIPNRLDQFLAFENICKLVRLFREVFGRDFINVFWRKDSDSFPERCINTVLQELENGEKPLSTAKIHRQLIAIDYGFFKKACYRYYKYKKSASL